MHGLTCMYRLISYNVSKKNDKHEQKHLKYINSVLADTNKYLIIVKNKMAGTHKTKNTSFDRCFV